LETDTWELPELPTATDPKSTVLGEAARLVAPGDDELAATLLAETPPQPASDREKTRAATTAMIRRLIGRISR